MRKKERKNKSEIKLYRTHVYVHIFTSYFFQYGALLRIKEISIQCFVFFTYFSLLKIM